MAALGAVAIGNFSSDDAPMASFIITEYDINIGTYLGNVALGTFTNPEPELAYANVTDYKVRQIGTVFRPLWVTSGQRWPVGNSQFPPAGAATS